ncbi:hypothetical protein M959_04822, partial [Chaetura pelagica]
VFSEGTQMSVALQSDAPFMRQYKIAKGTQTYLSELTESSLSGTMRNTVLTPTAVQMPPEETDVSEELEL